MSPHQKQHRLIREYKLRISVIGKEKLLKKLVKENASFRLLRGKCTLTLRSTESDDVILRSRKIAEQIKKIAEEYESLK